ncbi:tripartite tricarboxylate transporter TctB family protein [Thalassospira sp.]|uniref:tripartite tricarboxylate transporter TctB family protein n=1 Tax=Thalassospira sp. TaxID=1912094 RepID=UPI002733D33D|nr:tripartite tricarboxylate transporter TctB family protein [Thalassospira sp.]MDP2698433.1 tripartite tricarboxylate transporter TctB family protein [Thalassospira sp.]
MTINRDKFGALLFLTLALIYGYYIKDIPLLYGDEDAAFNAQTMPTAVAWLMGVVSFLQLVLPPRTEVHNLRDAFVGLQWRKVILLSVLMIFYGLTIRYLGFIISTSIFLLIGFMILGERRIKVLLGASIPVVVVFWFLLAKLMGVYLAPGDLFQIFG